MNNRIILRNYNPKDIIHPEDKYVISKLDHIPGFKFALKKSFGNLRASWAKVTYQGAGYAITKNSNYKLYKQFVEDCNILNLKDIPQFTAEWEYFISSFAIGGDEQRIVVTTGAIDLLTPEEFDFLLGHEIGHQICGHKPYHIFLETLYMPIINMTPGGKIWIGTVRSTLLDWYRISDYTADRMGLLACQDINVALRCMIKMAGIPKKYYDCINVHSFIKQAHEFDSMFSSISNQLVNYVSVNAACIPWLIARAAKLFEWYYSGKYECICNNS